MERERFIIELADRGGAVPLELRLRRLLKIAARSLNLICLAVRSVSERTGHAQTLSGASPTATYHEVAKRASVASGEKMN